MDLNCHNQWKSMLTHQGGLLLIQQPLLISQIAGFVIYKVHKICYTNVVNIPVTQHRHINTTNIQIVTWPETIKFKLGPHKI